MRRRLWGVLGGLAVVLATAVPSHAAPSVAMQVDAAHDGVQADGQPAPPLRRLWVAELGQPASFPLIADGRVFEIVRNVDEYGTRLFALDAGTGATAWSRSLGGTYYWAGAAYDAGKVFTLNFDGVLQAFDAASGAALWSRRLAGQNTYSSEPTVTGGVVYAAGGGGTISALDENTGDVRWTAHACCGDHSSPAIAGGRLFVGYAGPNFYGFDAGSGAQLWQYDPCCVGGGGKTPVYANGRVYDRDGSNGYVMDAPTGKLLDTFSSATAPAVAPDLGYVVSDGRLDAFDAAGGATRWSAGDGRMSSPPLVVGNVVYAASMTGTLFAFDRHSGQQVWSDALGTSFSPPDEGNVSVPVSGLGAGDGLLVVPADNGHVVAYESVNKPVATSAPSSSQPAASSAPAAATPPSTTPAGTRRSTTASCGAAPAGADRTAKLRALVRACGPRLRADLVALRGALKKLDTSASVVAAQHALRTFGSDLRALRRAVARIVPAGRQGRAGRRQLLLALKRTDRGARAVARGLGELRRGHRRAAKRTLTKAVRALAAADRAGGRAETLLGVKL